MPTTPNSLQPALYDECFPDERVRCPLCPHDCKIAPDRRGACGVRVNRRGATLYRRRESNCFCRGGSIEKKPLFHFLPGSFAYSIATVGCNFRCRFCQNWTISQWPKLRELEDRGEELPSSVAEHPGNDCCVQNEPTEDHWGLGTEVIPSEMVQQAR